MAGRLDGSVDGRPVSLLAEDQNISLFVNRFRTLFTFRKSWRTTLPALRTFLRATNFRLLVRVKWFGYMELFPRPSLLFRLFLPST